MTALGLAARWAHLACALGLVGLFAAMLLAGRSDRPTALRWAARMRALAGWLIGGVLVSGISVLAYQAMLAAGRTDALVDPGVWWRLLTQSRFGTVWVIRHATLLLLAALVTLRERETSAADTMAWRLEGWTLSVGAGATIAWAGHAAAVEPLGSVAALADALHVAAAGTWLGALLPLALLLRAGSSEAGADARPYAVLAIRRFSAVSLGSIALVATTGLANTWFQVGSVAGLAGTRYGWLLLLKVTLLACILAVAVVNRRMLLPALSRDGATVGRPAMTRVSRFIGCELVLALLILGLTAALSLTAPAKHEPSWWPFAFRLTDAAIAGNPGAASRVLVGAQLAVLGVLGLIVSWLMRSRRGAIGGALALGIGLWIALPPLAVDAYPTTYWRSPAPYQAASIATGAARYETQCASCHGARGRGDGVPRAGLPKPPADLTATHTASHTAGDLYWWITNGLPRSGMPPFGTVLNDDDRWDLVNFLRALSAGVAARSLTPVVNPSVPGPVAPDFSYTVGPTPTRALRELRGRRVVLLVLFSLPDSRARLAQLAESYFALEILGAEILAVPFRETSGIIGKLGANPPILFPVVTDAADDIARTYSLFGDTSVHAEFLIDRQGYLRARWRPETEATGWHDVRSLEAQIAALNAEPRTAPLPDEHVH